MSKSKLICFDTPVSRREKCRLALHFAGIDFEDVREALVAGLLPARARAVEKNITSSPSFSWEKIHVVDPEIFMVVRWFIGGKVDHIPPTISANYPRLTGVHDAVRDHAGVKSWHARS